MQRSKIMIPLLAMALVIWQAATAPPRPAEAQGAAEQPIVDFAFDPPELVVPTGATVVWTNRGATIHTVAPVDLSWSSPVLQPGEAFQYTYGAPGTYPILCTIHPDMQAVVRVQ